MSYTDVLAIGYSQSGPPAVLRDVPVEISAPAGRDVLVEVKAFSVNPIDTKLRRTVNPDRDPRILGFDAAGVVKEVGRDVTQFEPGDEVFYAGTLTRPGCNAELHLVDERLVAAMPECFTYTEAAALPLTAITAWEGLFERLHVGDSAGTLIVVGGAGGVGSMVIQLARALTNLTVIATARRAESRRWASSLGAHHVVDPADFVDAVSGCAPDGVDFIFSAYSSGRIDEYAAVMRPFGAIVGLDDPDPSSLVALKAKSVSWHWESMFTRPVFDVDPGQHHRILSRVAELADSGLIRSTVSNVLSPLSSATLVRAHELSESGSTVGKTVISVSE